jgi:acetyl esterase/lipase
MAHLKRYGTHPDQWVRLHLPEGRPRGVVVVLHGGFWKAEYGAELADPLSADLAARGWAAFTLEYRRVGAGGGVPETLDDVAAGIDAVATTGLDRQVPVVVLGHSAGGQLAAWAAARGRFERWAGGVEVAQVVSQAGVLDLVAGGRDGLGGGAVEHFLAGGGEEAEALDLADPSRHVPLDVPLTALHARDDTDVPFAQSEAYVHAAVEAGAHAELIEVTGGHFGLVTPGHAAWEQVVAVLDRIAAAGGSEGAGGR